MGIVTNWERCTLPRPATRRRSPARREGQTAEELTASDGSAGPSVGYFALAAIPARYALEHRDWKQAAQLALRETPFPYTDAMTWLARGLGAARLGRAQAANESATALGQIRERLSKSTETYWAQQVEIQEVTVRA